MRKLSVFGLTLIATVAVGGVTAFAGNGNGDGDFERVPSKVSAMYNEGPYDPYAYYDEAVIKGKVKVANRDEASKAARKKCKRKRNIVVKSPGGGQFAVTQTNGKGRYSVEADTAYTQPGEYTVKAKKKKKFKTKINCRPDKTTVTVDPYTP